MQKLTPCLWFDFNAEEAVHHYMSIFKRSRILETLRYSDAKPSYAQDRPDLEDKVLTMRFELEGQEFQALNAGPQFPFTEAISISVDCADQAEVDRLWSRLSEGGSPGPCGWLKDKFGLSWQIVPNLLPKLLADPDPHKRQRVMDAMMQMTKLDIAALQAAYEGS